MPYENNRWLWAMATLACCMSLNSYSNPLFAQAENKLAELESEETTRLIAEELPHWKMWKGPNRERELKLEPKSVLRWTNPGTGRVYGDLYIWTADGRPEVAMSLFKAWEPANGFHAEMQSLSGGAIEAGQNDQLTWHPTKPGVEMKALLDSVVPEETPARRLVQMRGYAKEFTAVLTDYRRNQTGERQELRLLTQPLFRYRCSDTDLIDGALFGFVLGTDPEMFLLLEARQLEGKAVWQYGLARMNNDSMTARHKDQAVFQFERSTTEDPLRSTYVLMRVPEASARN